MQYTTSDQNAKELIEQVLKVLEVKSTPKYFTTKEVAALLHVTPRTIFNLCQKGMPYYKIGGRVLFMECELNEFVRKHSISQLRR